MLSLLFGEMCGQAIEWKSKYYKATEKATSVDITATIRNTTEEPCFMMISQAYYVTPDSLDKALSKKLNTRFGDLSLGMFIGDEVTYDEAPSIWIPETFVKKLMPKDRFRFVISTTQDNEAYVKKELTSRVLIVPDSTMRRLMPNFESRLQEFLYKPKKVSVFGGDLTKRQIKSPIVLAHPKLPKDPTVPNLDCDVPAEYPDGWQGVLAFLLKNFRYPPTLAEAGIHGRVTISFSVEKDGSLSDFAAMHSPAPELTEEVIRVMKLMPKWKPAQWRGRVVKSSTYILPFSWHER